MSDGTVSWRELLAQATDLLGDSNEARWLCEDVSDTRGAQLQATLEDPVTERAVARFDSLLARRLQGEPLQYVLGSWSFRQLELMVDQRVLIPRADTEVVAGVAIDLARSFPSPVRVADLGTGSGAIALSVATELPVGSVEVWATDVSNDALDVARANLAGIGRKAPAVRMTRGDWYQALPADLLGSLHVIVANPPYLAHDDPEVDHAVRAWEPAAALFADRDGLAAHDVIIAGAPDWLAPGGWLVLEIGHRQAAVVMEQCERVGLDEVEVRPDGAGRDRVVLARRPTE